MPLSMQSFMLYDNTMNHPQHLPTYIHAFETYDNWLKKEAGIYHFFYTPDSSAEKDIEHIMTTQLSACKKVTEFLNLRIEELPSRIEYYFYPDIDLKKKLMGDEWYAQAIYGEMRIHTLYTNEIKPIGPHEDTHLLSLPLGLAVGFIQEGLAEYMVGRDWYGNDHAGVIKEGIKNDWVKLKPELLTEHSAWLSTDDAYARHFYALAATFTKFLIETFGKESYLHLYKMLDRNDPEENRLVYVKIFNLSPHELIKKYQEFINVI